MFLFLLLAFGSGALDTYLKGYSFYVEAVDRQLMASDAQSEDLNPDVLLRQPWRGEENGRAQALYGCQGIKKQRRERTYGLD